VSVDEWDTGEVPRTDIAEPGQKLPVPDKLRVLVLSGPDQGKQLLLERGTYLVGKGHHPHKALIGHDHYRRAAGPLCHRDRIQGVRTNLYRGIAQEQRGSDAEDASAIAIAHRSRVKVESL